MIRILIEFDELGLLKKLVKVPVSAALGIKKTESGFTKSCLTTTISQKDTFVSYKSTKTQDILARGFEINQKVTKIPFHAFSITVLNKLRAGAF